MRDRENIWNLPNMLTMLRIVLIAIFVLLYTSGLRLLALAVFIMAAVTDFLDGYIARKRQLVTNFGKLMDPLADKLMLIAALICLSGEGLVPVWVVATVAVKEFVMVGGGVLLLRQGIVVQAKMIGKVATVLFIVAVSAAFLHAYIAPWDTVLLYAAVILTLVALLWYVISAVKVYKRTKKSI